MSFLNKQTKAELFPSQGLDIYNSRHQFSQFQSQTSSFVNENPHKNPVKYYYLTSQQQAEQRRSWRIFWLQSFSMFVFIYSTTCYKQNTGIDLQFFVGFLMAITICAKQTGANLNPAVSLGMIFKANTKQLTYYSLMWLYIKAQIIGSLVSFALAMSLNRLQYGALYPSSSQLYDGLEQNKNGSIHQIIISEAIGLFILISFLLYITGPYTFINQNGPRYLFIATFIYISRKFAVMSGNQINIALTISHAFVGMLQCNLLGFKYLILWVVGDVVGVLVGALFYKKILQPTLDYLLRHKTAKEMDKLQTIAERQLKEIKKGGLGNQNKLKFSQRKQKAQKLKSKQEISNSSSQDNRLYKDYSKNLQYF